MINKYFTGGKIVCFEKKVNFGRFMFFILLYITELGGIGLGIWYIGRADSDT
jgi:hypothetical protein